MESQSPPPVLNIAWPEPPADWAAALRSDGAAAETVVQVWAFPLDLPNAAIEDLRTLLSASERERAARFRLKLHGDRFVAGRGTLRRALASYLSADPAALEFAFNASGKPSLAGAWSESRLQFNLAHSENLALLALTNAPAVGVDVEHLRSPNDLDDLVTRFFSPEERSAFESLAADLKPAAFFNWWTRKEACLKATGAGISQGLDKVSTTFLPGAPVRLLHAPDLGPDAAPRYLCELTPAPGFVAALAVAAEAVRLNSWAWPPIRITNRPPADSD